MSKLFAFGCSFTEDFDHFVNDHNKNSPNPPTQYRYIMEFLNGEIPKAWPQILAERLGMEVRNYGMGGDCNDGIFERVCIRSDEFEKDDIVIVGWTHYSRFRWPKPDIWLYCYPNYVHQPWPPNVPTEDEHNKIILSRESDLILDELYNRQKLLITLSQAIGFKLFFWAACPKTFFNGNEKFEIDRKFLLSDVITKGHSVFDEMNKHGASSIDEETNGLIVDYHRGKKGHQIQADLFYNHIINS